jgi:hypothetical protein
LILALLGARRNPQWVAPNGVKRQSSAALNIRGRTAFTRAGVNRDSHPHNSDVIHVSAVDAA